MSAQSIQDQMLQGFSREFRLRKLKNPAYSLRAFARDMGMQPSAVSEILSGKRGITRRVGAKLLSKLSIPGDEAARISSQLRGKNPRPMSHRAYSMLERDTFQMVADWYYFAILSLSETRGFQEDPEWIASRLGINVTQARDALQTLERLELLRRDAKTRKLVPTGRNFSTTTDIPDLAIQRAHHQNLELASHALTELPVAEREFSFMTIAADPARLEAAKDRIREFRRGLCEFLESGSTKTEVYRLSTQLFPLTRPNFKQEKTK